MNRDTIWQVVIGVVIVAVIYMLVRPNSPAGDAVKQVSDALSNIIHTATSYSVNSPGVTG